MKQYKTKKRKILSKLKTPTSLDELVESTKLKKGDVWQIIQKLKNKGYPIYKNGDLFFLDVGEIGKTYSINLPKHSLIAAIGDTHIGSKYERLDLLSDFYDFAEKEGAMYVLHVGDFIQGVGIYPTELSDLKKFTIDDQLDYFNEVYPKSKLKTIGILGNHDLKQFEKGKSPNPAKLIDRDEIIILGNYYGRLQGKGTEILIDLIHPAKQGSYAISYNAQKYIEKIKPGDKPNILLWGHNHDALYLPYRNVHCIKCGTFQDQNPFTLRRGLMVTLGGWLIELKHDGEEIDWIKPTFKQYYI